MAIHNDGDDQPHHQAMPIDEVEDEQPNSHQPRELFSLHSLHRLLVQFVNRTGRQVDIIWVDYAGHFMLYKTLDPGDRFETYTFVTHPWLFRDKISRTKLTALGYGNVFNPRPTDVQEAFDPEGNIHLLPTIVSIIVPLMTLKERCLETMQRCLPDKHCITSLEIPLELQRDIYRKFLENEQEIVIPADILHQDYH